MSFAYHNRAALKIKIASTAAESAAIRKSVARWHRKAARASLRQKKEVTDKSIYTANHLDRHRRMVVRPEVRCAHIAMGFLKGIPYVEIERKILLKGLPNWHYEPKLRIERFWKRILEIVTKFGNFPKQDVENGAVELAVMTWRDNHPCYRELENPKDWWTRPIPAVTDANGKSLSDAEVHGDYLAKYTKKQSK